MTATPQRNRFGSAQILEFEYLLLVLLGFSASIVSAVFGFGTALIVLAVGSHILPVKETIVLGTVLFAASTVFKTVFFGKHVDWKVAGTIAVASLPFAYLGASLLFEVPAELRLLVHKRVQIFVQWT